MKKILFGLVAAMCCLAMAAPVFADIKIGGMVTADMYYYNRSKERLASALFGFGETGAAAFDHDDLTILRFAMPQAWNRWWVDYKSEDKKIAGYIQIRAGGSKANFGVGNQESQFTWEYAWIDWHFNPNFYLRAGRQTQAFAITTPDQNMGHVDGHIVGAGFGNIHGGTSRDGIRAYIKFSDMVRMEIQLLDPNAESAASDELNAAYPYLNGATVRAFSGLTAVGAGAVLEENKLPRFDLAVPIKIANFSIEPSFTWLRQQWNFPDGLGLSGDDTVDTWAFSVGSKAGFGPFTISGEVTYGQNLGFSGSYVGANTFAVPSFGTNAAGTSIVVEDTKELAAWLQLGFDFGPFAIQGVIGMDRAENDGIPGLDALGFDNTDTKVTTWMYGLNFPIKVAKNFTVTPNIFYYDYDNDAEMGWFRTVAGADENRNRGEEIMVGVQFNLTF